VSTLGRKVRRVRMAHRTRSRRRFAKATRARLTLRPPTRGPGFARGRRGLAPDRMSCVEMQDAQKFFFGQGSARALWSSRGSSREDAKSGDGNECEDDADFVCMRGLYRLGLRRT